MKFKIFIYLFLSLLAANASGQIQAYQRNPIGFRESDIRMVDSVVYVFMKKYSVPGLSFSIAKDDRLKMERTYGFADIEKKEMVKPSSRFRIASVSKPFTSAAIMMLVEKGKLRLTDKVFGVGGILGTNYGAEPYGRWITDISIGNLLEHTAGGWSNEGNDPMFMHKELNQSQLISWTLNNLPLNYQPGTRYLYSNFGYCLLGRVIEKISGMSYEEFIRENIFRKCQISIMEIGGNLLIDRKKDEVCYYDVGGDAYRMDVRRMDSHGGWIATASDLVKFLVRMNENHYQSELLSPGTLGVLYRPALPGSNYAKGWLVNNANNHWHNGSLPGEQAVAVNKATGFSWAVLVNTRAEGKFGEDLDQLMWQIKDCIHEWPSVDLFSK